jgi:beta-N-acetylhexosaminidase
MVDVTLRRLSCLVAAGVVLVGCGAAPATEAPEPSVLPAPPTAAPPEPTVDPVLACVAALPRDVRIGQTMLVTTTDLPRVQQWLDEGLIAGLLANGRLTWAEAAALEQATAGGQYGAILAADEEGGEVQRYREVVGAIPSPRTQARTMAPDEVRELYLGMGEALADWGVDMVFAPTVDVGHGPGIGSRAYSDDPEVVTEFALASAQGLAEAGLLPVLKHFPGHGRTTGDSHYEIASGPSLAALREVDLQPFREIPAELEVGVMVGHTSVPDLTDAPSSQSAEVIDGLLVDELGFSGLVVSDALGMTASGAPTQGAALVGFIRAGGHLGIVGPGGSVEGRRALRRALKDGTVSEERLNAAAARVLAFKGIDPCALPELPAPSAGSSDVPSDSPVVNPTEES